ncbi:MAG TPA: putative Ig domain-containing protein [Terracidiphilus sp.]|jgi:hypothetical protein
MRNLNIYIASGIALMMAPAITACQTSLTISTTALPIARVADSYNTTISATGGLKPYTFTATKIPPGLTLSASTGVISGIPKEVAVGTHEMVVTVTDSTKPVHLVVQEILPLGVNDAETVEACGQLNLGWRASFNGFVPFEPSDAWVTDISAAPLDPNNAAITSASGFAGLHLHHDWSSVAGGNYGIPYTVVDSSTTPFVTIHVIDYADESDVARAPFPISAPIEGSPKDCAGWPDKYIGDTHVLVVDRRTCMLYETFNTHRCNGAWNSSSETIWDLKKYENRPWGWTSGDAAGLPIMPGLVRYDEIQAGEIKHALRFTMQSTKNDANGGYFVEPAAHAAGNYYGVSNVMGMRIRLKAGFDISGYSKTNQIILTAMKKYGMILADNGGYFFFQGVPDPRWNDDDLHHLDAIQSSNFEVVQMTPKWPGWDSATAPTGGKPVIHSFTASPTTITAGTPVTLTWNTTGDSYLFVDKVGGVRGTSVTVHPGVTATFTLTATNQYGRVTKSVTVTVK